MKNFLIILNEWKTYILVVTLVICSVLNGFCIIDEKTFQTISVTLVGLISAIINQNQKQIEHEFRRSMKK